MQENRLSSKIDKIRLNMIISLSTLRTVLCCSFTQWNSVVRRASSFVQCDAVTLAVSGDFRLAAPSPARALLRCQSACTFTPLPSSVTMRTPVLLLLSVLGLLALVPAAADVQNYLWTHSSGASLVVPTSGFNDTGFHDDDAVFNMTLPFPVSLYGTTYTSAFIGTNGDIQFASSSGDNGNQIPYPRFQDALLIMFTDLITGNDASGGLGIFLGISGDIKANTAVGVLEFRTTYCCGNEGPPTDIFQVLFTQTLPTSFAFIYGNMSQSNMTGSGVVGVQHDMFNFTAIRLTEPFKGDRFDLYYPGSSPIPGDSSSTAAGASGTAATGASAASGATGASNVTGSSTGTVCQGQACSGNLHLASVWTLLVALSVAMIFARQA